MANPTSAAVYKFLAGSGILPRADLIEAGEPIPAGIPIIGAPSAPVGAPMNGFSNGLASFFPVTDSGGETNIFDVINTGIAAFTQLPETISRLPEPVMGPGNPVIQTGTGVSVGVRGDCWQDLSGLDPRSAARQMLKRRVRFRRRPDGGIEMVSTCAPRRMNPLNPRALARAGRRVGSFTRIAKGMMKMLEQSCRSAAKPRRRPFSMPRKGGCR